MAKDVHKLKTTQNIQDAISTESTELLKLPNDELGFLFRRYLEDSNEGSWEGFERRDQRGIARFLTDMNIFYQHDGHGSAQFYGLNKTEETSTD